MLCGFAGQDGTAAAAKVREWQKRQREFLAATDLKRKSAREQVALTGVPVSGIMNRTLADGGLDVRTVGKISKDIYECVTEDIVTDEVIVTDERVQHIRDRHPGDYERYFRYIKEIVEEPDYILEANKPNSALVLKHIEENGKSYKMILRLKTSCDSDEYKNSIISFQKVEEKRYSRYTNSEKVLYKRG